MRTLTLTMILVVVTLCGAAFAADEKPILAGHTQPTVPLERVLEAVGRNDQLLFAVDSTVNASVVLGQLSARDMNYAQLLLVLRNNGLAAVRVEDVINIMPVRTIRQAALPLLLAADDSVNTEEWVTRVINVQNTEAKMLVPILRPVLPQQGHLVAHTGSNTLIMVDRYGNTQRIAKIVAELDVASAQ